MSNPFAENSREGTLVSRKKRGSRLTFSIGALFGVITAICVYQAYRTNRQIAKYYTPAPAVSYSPKVTTYVFKDDDFVHPLDPRPATAQLQERVKAISDRIADLASRGEAQRAAEMQGRLDKILTNREGPYPMDGTIQLHAIGLYSGGRMGDPHVRITYTGAPLVVAMCAYDPVRWIIEVGPGVQLKKVLLSGYHNQQVQGLPENVRIEGQVAGGRNGKYVFYADTALEAQPAAEQLRELTGLDATTFFTTHEYEGTPFVIGPGGSEWTASMTLHALDPLYQEAIRDNRAHLAKAIAVRSFPEIHCSAADQYGRFFHATLAIHSAFGPYADTMQPLQQATTQFAIDPRGPSFFGWSRDGIVTIDPDTGRMTPWPIVGPEHHPAEVICLAFDTTRNRLLLWGRDLLAIDILKKEASEVRKGNPAVLALTYSKDDDRLYACCAPYDGNSNNQVVSDIRTFNHRGAELSRTKLTVPIPAGQMKVNMVDGKLLIMQLGGYDGNHYLIPSDTNYLVDPQTGSLLFACRRKPR